MKEAHGVGLRFESDGSEGPFVADVRRHEGKVKLVDVESLGDYEDGEALAKRGILYSPDFVANAGGLIRLAGLYLGMTEAEIDHKITEIEHTTAAVLAQSGGGSTGAAAIAFAKAKIAAGAAKKQMAGAGCGAGCGCKA